MKGAGEGEGGCVHGLAAGLRKQQCAHGVQLLVDEPAAVSWSAICTMDIGCRPAGEAPTLEVHGGEGLATRAAFWHALALARLAGVGAVYGSSS